MEHTQLTLSPLRKTWIFDFDGTLVVHNGYKTGEDRFLPSALELLQSIPEEDFILILTAREQAAEAQTKQFLAAHHVRYDMMLFDMPMGERRLFNDTKPSGLKMGYAVECTRDEGLDAVHFRIDETL